MPYNRKIILDKHLCLTISITIYFIKLITKNHFNINKLSQKYKNERWSKVIKKKKDLDNFYKLDKNINKNKFYKKLRATITKNFKPYCVIHNKKFVLSDEK